MIAPTGPPDLAPAGPKQQQRGIQLPQLLLSLLVVAVFALLAVWWQASTTSRTPVLALANDVQQWQTVNQSDFVEIFISTDVPANVVASSSASRFVGARPVTDLAAGTLVTGDLFVAGAELAEGQAFVGLELGRTRSPRSIVEGDRVQVLVGSSDGEVEILSPDARVESARLENDVLSVLLRLDTTAAQRVQTQADRVVIIEVDNQGLADWETEAPS